MSEQRDRAAHADELPCHDTRDDTVRAHPPPGVAVRFGVYACSPGESSFAATFDELSSTPCRWEPHADWPPG